MSVEILISVYRSEIWAQLTPLLYFHSSLKCHCSTSSRLQRPSWIIFPFTSCPSARFVFNICIFSFTLSFSHFLIKIIHYLFDKLLPFLSYLILVLILIFTLRNLWLRCCFLLAHILPNNLELEILRIHQSFFLVWLLLVLFLRT